MKIKKLATATALTAGLLLGSVSGAVADDAITPTPTATASSTDSAAVAAYKAAMIQYRTTVLTQQIAYRTAMEKFRADWKAAVEKNAGTWQTEMEKFRVARAAWAAKTAPLISNLKAAIVKADSDYLLAKTSATTSVQESAALKAHSVAVTAARATFKSAMTALGNPPVKPAKPAELTKPAEPAKPVPPIKPIAPVRPAKK